MIMGSRSRISEKLALNNNHSTQPLIANYVQQPDCHVAKNLKLSYSGLVMYFLHYQKG